MNEYQSTSSVLHIDAATNSHGPYFATHTHIPQGSSFSLDSVPGTSSRGSHSLLTCRRECGTCLVTPSPSAPAKDNDKITQPCNYMYSHAT